MSTSGQNQLRSWDSVLSSPNKAVSLNPNAAEFVPSALRYLPIQTERSDLVPTPVGETSKFSDDEAQQYWCSQLPDDITPDFNIASQQDLSFSGLSLNGPKSSTFSVTKVCESPEKQSNFMLQQVTRSHKLDSPSASRQTSRENYLEEKHLTDRWNVALENVSSGGMTLDHFEILSSRFPLSKFESLAEVYFANGGDLKSTVEMLSQLELKADAGFNKNMSTESVLTPAMNEADFHSFVKNGNGLQKLQQPEGFPLFKPPSLSVDIPVSRGFFPTMYGSHVLDGIIDSAKVSPTSEHTLLRSPYNTGKTFFRDHSDGYGKLPADLIAAQVYSDMREEALELTRIRSAFLGPQEKNAYSIGNRALSKDLYLKGQLYNYSLKEAQEKSMHSQRGLNPLIDLHGLHVNEAMHVLKHELSILRRTAKTAGRRLQVMVCVGVDAPVRSPRPPSRLATVVQQYLLRENLQFSEDQPGLLRVVI